MMATFVFSIDDGLLSSGGWLAGNRPQRLLQLATRGERILDIEPEDFSSRIEQISSRLAIAADLFESGPTFVEQIREVRASLLQRGLGALSRLLHNDSNYGNALLPVRLDDVGANVGKLLSRHAAIAIPKDHYGRLLAEQVCELFFATAAKLRQRDWRQLVADPHAAKRRVLLGQHDGRDLRRRRFLLPRSGRRLGFRCAARTRGDRA
jgi:hypothetical protein